MAKKKTQKNTSKSLFKSKTFWFNALTVITVVATMFGYTPDQELAENASTFLLTLSPLMNIVLRYMTHQAVTLN